MKQLPRSLSIIFLAGLLSGNAFADTVEVTRQVLLPDGRPAAGARVLIRIPKADGTWREMRMVTDAEGVYAATVNLPDHSKRTPTLPLPYVIVDVVGSALAYSRLGGSPEYESEDTKPLRLIPAYGLHGTVIQGANVPVVGARITLAALQTGQGSQPQWQRLVSSEDDTAPSELVTHSATDGKFTLRGVSVNGIFPVWQVALTATTKQRAASLAGETRIPLMLSGSRNPQQPAKPLMLPLNPRTTIRGRTINPLTGHPIAAAKVELGTSTTFLRIPSPVTTQANGHFEFKAVPQPDTLRLWITASHPDYSSGQMILRERSNSVESVQPVSDLMLRLRPMIKVTGKVVDAETGQAPPGRIAVWPKYEQKDKYGRLQLEHTNDFQFTQEDGSFAVKLPIGFSTVYVAEPLSGMVGPVYASTAYHEQRVELNIKPVGQQPLVLKIHKRPGFLVRFEAGDLTALSASWLYLRTPENGEKRFNFGTLWFYPVNQWDKKGEIRVTRGDPGAQPSTEQEIVPWTTITADPKTWPSEIHIP